MQKYSILKNNIKQFHTFNYHNSYNCGENLGLNKCKYQLEHKIKIFSKKELAKKYNINSSLLKMDEIKLQNNIQSSTTNVLIVTYNGKVQANALSVKNPYIDEINSLNAFLGEKKVFEEDAKQVSIHNLSFQKSRTPSFKKKFSETISNIGDSIIKRQYMLFYTSFGAGNFLFDWIDSNDDSYWLSYSTKNKSSSIEFYAQLTPTSPFMLKLGQGKATYKSTSSYNGYANPTEYATDKDYSFDYNLVGMSFGDGRKYLGWLGADIDYIIPSPSTGKISSIEYNGNRKFIKNTTKMKETIDPFFNFSINLQVAPNKHLFALGIGLHYSSNEAMKSQWITLKAGIVF